jgi:hypothetical protein
MDMLVWLCDLDIFSKKGNYQVHVNFYIFTLYTLRALLNYIYSSFFLPFLLHIRYSRSYII